MDFPIGVALSPNESFKSDITKVISMAYSESDLVIPALQLLKENLSGLHTSDLIEKLTESLKPTGEDMKILEGRRDTHFSQKVRNLKSHDTLIKNGLATYEETASPKGGLHKITEKGLEYLEEVEPIAESLEKQGFEIGVMDEEFKKDLTEIVIEEGQLEKRSIKQRKRSTKLRDAAIWKFKNEHGGELFCEACGFNFHEVYGDLGKDFITVHHKKPVHSMEIEGDKTTLEKALAKVTPLCANCHAMVHRGEGKLLSIEELKEIVAKQSGRENPRKRAKNEKRPLVFMNTGNLRLGKGFSHKELKESGVGPNKAKGHGIFYDKRRKSVHRFNIQILNKLIRR